jgi:hypothetical protein
MDQALARKLGPAARRALADPERTAESPLNLMVATNGGLNPGQRERLAGIGCRLRTVTGDIVTADVPAGALPELVALDFVRYVELSRPLRLEQGGEPPEG